MNKKEINNLFHKVYKFHDTEQWVLPKEVFVSPKWSIFTLQNSKQELNGIKSLLNDFNLEEWSKHTKYRDPSSFIIRHLKQNIQPELLTQAWCKFYETLCKFPIIPQEAIAQQSINSLHLCEAPGAFVCSLNHYLKLNHPDIRWKWTANTLYPNYEGNELSQMIPDDRLIKYTVNNWNFGADMTGDLTKYYNHKEITSHFDENKVWLVTSDGSVNCMDDPGEQEKSVEFLHYCEAMTALSTLKPGGSFVLKIFTMFEDSTISLLYLLNCLFAKVNAFKPCSSKAGNSEIYLVCTEYKGFDSLSTIWEKLLKPYKNGAFNEEVSLFDLQLIPEDFLKQLSECSNYFKIRQIKTITDNVSFFTIRKNVDSRKIHYMKITVAHKYINKCKLLSILDTQKIVPHCDILHSWRNFIDIYKFEEEFRCLNTSELIHVNSGLTELEMKYGKRFDCIKSSKFATKESLECFNANFGDLHQSKNLYVDDLNKISNNYAIFSNTSYNFQINSKFQIKFLNDICNLEEKDLVFIEIPFLTHFMVGLLFILLEAYEFLYLNNKSVLILKNANQNLELVKVKLQCIKTSYNDIESLDFDCDILEIVPSIVFDDNLSFLTFVWQYNNILAINPSSTEELRVQS